MGSGAKPQLTSNLVHFSLKIWHLVETIIMIFLIIKGPNFMYFKQYSCKFGLNFTNCMSLPFVLCPETRPIDNDWLLVLVIIVKTAKFFLHVQASGGARAPVPHSWWRQCDRLRNSSVTLRNNNYGFFRWYTRQFRWSMISRNAKYGSVITRKYKRISIHCK